MSARELLSLVVIMTSFLVLMMEMSTPAMAFQNTDLIGPSQDSVYDQADIMGDNLPEMLQLLEALLETSFDDRPTESLANKKQIPTITNSATPHTQSELTSLLDRILSSSTSLTQEPKIFPLSLDGAGYQDDIPVMTSKRAREDYGAMPPLNELCRMMRVKCY